MGEFQTFSEQFLDNKKEHLIRYPYYTRIGSHSCHKKAVFSPQYIDTKKRILTKRLLMPFGCSWYSWRHQRKSLLKHSHSGTRIWPNRVTRYWKAWAAVASVVDSLNRGDVERLLNCYYYPNHLTREVGLCLRCTIAIMPSEAHNARLNIHGPVDNQCRLSTLDLMEFFQIVFLLSNF